MMPPFSPGQPVIVGTNPDWVSGLKRRRAAIQRLCSGLSIWLSRTSPDGVGDICAAIEELLGFEIDQTLKNLENPRPSSHFQRPAITPEVLVAASDRRDQIQKQIDALDAFVKELSGAQGDFLDAQLRPPLLSQLADAESWLANLQREMEAQDSEKNA